MPYVPKADPSSAANVPYSTTAEPGDTFAIINAREANAREGWVKVMGARDARNSLRECYRREGVNHLDKCKEFAEAYITAIRQPFFPGIQGRVKAHESRVTASEGDSHEH